jgi:hypothetical protein
MEELGDKVRQIIATGETREKLILALGLDAVLTFPFVICALAVVGTANAGFNAFLTAVLNASYIGGAYYVIRNSKTPIAVSNNTNWAYLKIQISVNHWIDMFSFDRANFIAYFCLNFVAAFKIGFLIGVTAAMSALNLTTGIYWGQLSNCTEGIHIAYGGLSVFAILLFLWQLGLCYVIVQWRGDLIIDFSAYDDGAGIPSAESYPSSGMFSAGIKSSGQRSSLMSSSASADLWR